MMRDIHLTDAAKFLDKAAEVLREANSIRNAALHRAAVAAAKAEAQRLMKATEDALARA
jgi:hypothetical protein